MISLVVRYSRLGKRLKAGEESVDFLIMGGYKGIHY